MNNHKDISKQFCNDILQELIDITKKVLNKSEYWIQCRENAKSKYLKNEYNELAWLTHDLIVSLDDLTKSYNKLYIFEKTEFEKSEKNYNEELKNLYNLISSNDVITEEQKNLVESIIKTDKDFRDKISSDYDLSMVLSIMPLYILCTHIIPPAFSDLTPMEWKKILTKTGLFLLDFIPSVSKITSFALYLKELCDEFDNGLKQQNENNNGDQFVRKVEFQKIRLQIAIYSVKRTTKYYEDLLNKKNNKI